MADSSMSNDRVGAEGDMIIDSIEEETVEESLPEIEIGCTMDVNGNYIPKCPSSMRPTIGMTFATLPEGVDYYKKYGQYCGFMIRLNTQKKTKSGIVCLKYVTCAREGENSTRKESEDTDNQQYKKRRCVTTRTGCKAMISFRLIDNGKYMVVKFDDAHNHPFYSACNFQELRGNRTLTNAQRQFIMDCQKASVSATVAYNVYSSIVGGDENVGATVTDFRNYQRDLKVYISQSDVQMVINEFIKEQISDPDFYYEYERDENDRLTRIFWADGLSRINYGRWGDCVSFDSTYGTNRYSMVFCPFTGVDNHDRCVTFAAALISKEDISSFIWVFECFLRAMNNKHPLCMITDQDPAMKNAIGQVFTESRHRFCMWHIMKKLPEKVRRTVATNSPFYHKFNSIVWSDTIDTNEFEDEWKNIMEEFSLQTNDFLNTMYDIRSYWIPAYFKNDPMGMLLRTTSRSESENSTFGFNTSKVLTLKEFMWRFNGVVKTQHRQHMKIATKYAAASRPSRSSVCDLEIDAWNVFTRPLFNKIREDIIAGVFSCGIEYINKDAGITEYTVQGEDNEPMVVIMDNETKHCTCPCKRFEGRGLICVHIFAALNAANVRRIPRSLINERWCRDPPVPETLNAATAAIESQKTGINLMRIEIWSTVQSMVCSTDTTESDLESLLAALNKHRLSRNGTQQTQPELQAVTIEETSGIPKPPLVQVHIPNVCKNKGSGRRLQSEREKAMNNQAGASGRKCGYCDQSDGHNIRKCPIRIAAEAAKQQGGGIPIFNLSVS